MPTTMPFLDDQVQRHLLWPKNAQWPKRRANALLQKFQSRFSDIKYELISGVLLANAQAVTIGGTRYVRVYEGLVRHKRLRASGLAVALAHETGHHLGGPPFDPTLPWLSTEERATEWAFEEGLLQLFGKDRARYLMTDGSRNLAAICAQ